MFIRKRYYIVLGCVIICTACTNLFHQPIQFPLSLTDFTENTVNVFIKLEKDLSDQFYISATFIPPDGFHLYSKDIPLSGVNGLGRPTLLSLPENSQLISVGELIESIKPEIPQYEPNELLIYPIGAVTLKLPVKIPLGNQWIQETILISFMACNETGCKPPVVEKKVIVKIPSLNMLE